MSILTEEIIQTQNDLATYRIGETAPQYIPNEQVHHHMVRLIAYDITTPKRLRRVAKTCEDYGCRIEKSVFECDLDEATFAIFWEQILGEIDPEEDSLIAYRVCKSCVKEIQSAGVVERPAIRLLYLF
ncbi:MAG: CRISPR-associated endonuclease Cas2 [Lentisphaerae bacterium]|nr:CRISPR-associated endonuclease Cas2 [Lentisphaerota bacterium]